MNENSREERTSISKVDTPQKIGEFWDSRSLADYSESIREVSLAVDARLTEDRPVSVSASRKSTLDKFGASKTKHKFSRICWNTAGWRKPTGDAASVETKSTFVAEHHFGLEEWLFNFEWMIGGFRYGFLQPIGKYYSTYKGSFRSILLYTVTPEKDTLLVAKIENVYIPEEDELDRVLRKFKKSGWMNSMRTDVDAVGGDPTVLDNAEPSGIVNIRFKPENLKIFDPMPRVTGNYRFSKEPRFYHPFNWDGNLPDTKETPPPDVVDPTRSEGERTRAAQEGVRFDPGHVRLQNRLYGHLCEKYGNAHVLYENCYVDLTLNEPTGCTFFEIKMESTVKRCIRSALGQLLEYAHYPTGSRAKRLVVVGDVLPTDDDRRYVSLLREKYRIPIYYRRFHWEKNKLGKEI